MILILWLIGTVGFMFVFFLVLQYILEEATYKMLEERIYFGGLIVSIALFFFYFFYTMYNGRTQMKGVVKKLITFEEPGETYDVRQYILVLKNESGEKNMYVDSGPYFSLEEGMNITLIYDTKLQDALKITLEK